MPRKLLNQLTNVLLVVWPIEVVVMLLPTGMISVLNGTIDDGWNGVLGWFWLACASLTGVLAWFTRAALRERSYSAVMAATGLSYLAILMGFGTDLVARALLMV
jgi:CHASE2 domain-containing sensor protein